MLLGNVAPQHGLDPCLCRWFSGDARVDDDLAEVFERHEEPDLVTWSSGNRQAFANRFAVNDPLRTCDMHQTLIGLLHYSFEVFTSGGPVLDGRDYGPWVPITVGPWE